MRCFLLFAGICVLSYLNKQMPLYLNFKNIVLEKGLLAKYNHYIDVFQTKAPPNFVMKIIKKTLKVIVNARKHLQIISDKEST